MLEEVRSVHDPLSELLPSSSPPPLLLAGPVAWGRWDTPPIVDFVRSASTGLADRFGSALLEDALAEVASKKSLSLQSVPTKKLTPILYPCVLHVEFCRRLCLWLPEARSVPDLPSLLLPVLSVLSAMKPMFKDTFFKTIGQTWPTASRKGDPVLPCCLGCHPPLIDTLKHYIRCPKLWQCIYRLKSLEPPVSVLAVLGIGLPEPAARIALYCLHIGLTAYQAHVYTHTPILANFHDAIRRTDMRS